MKETMNEQQVEFANKMREYDLSYETDLRFSSFKLDVCLCDDGVSFPPLESEPEVLLNSPLTNLSLVPSFSPSTPRDKTIFIKTLTDPLFPVA